MSRARDTANQINRVNSSAADATAITVDSSEKVGIGTSSPNKTLTVAKAQTAQTAMEVLRLTGSGAYTNGTDSTNAGAALSFGQYNTTYPNWNLAQIDGIRTGSSWGGSLVFRTNNNTAQTNSTERIRIDSDGLKFHGDTAAANALNDYEEGTWTPTGTSGVGFASNSAYGSYTKIGNVVTLHATLIVESNSSSAHFRIDSLPFNQSSGNAAAGFYMRYTTDSTYRMFYISTGNTIDVYNLWGGATNFSSVSTKRFDFSGVYYTDS